MEINRESLVDSFLSNIKSEVDHKKKLSISELDQLEKILEVVINYLKYFSDVSVKTPKIISGNPPHIIFDFPDLEFEEIYDLIQKLFMEVGIKFKRHKFQGSLPIISAKNNTVPGLVYGRGYFLVTFSTKFKEPGISMRIECLRENQVIKIIDGKIENLSIAYWSGSSVSRSKLYPDPETPGVNLENLDNTSVKMTMNLYSAKKGNNIRVSGDFLVTLNNGVILKKITSLIPI